jgi:hypothetical protein
MLNGTRLPSAQNLFRRELISVLPFCLAIFERGVLSSTNAGKECSSVGEFGKSLVLFLKTNEVVSDAADGRKQQRMRSSDSTTSKPVWEE